MIDIFYLACPDRFEAFDGDVRGGGLTGGYDASIQKCADDCTARSDCNGFVHSEDQQSCKLVNEKQPTASKWQDFQFCSKIGKYFERYTQISVAILT